MRKHTSKITRPIFNDALLPAGWWKTFDFGENHHVAYFTDIYAVAFRHDRLHLIPSIEEARAALVKQRRAGLARRVLESVRQKLSPVRWWRRLRGLPR